MQFTKASILAALVATVSAIQVTEPATGDSVDLSKSTTIKWSSVSSDPTTFDIFLVNMAVYPTVNISIATDVETSSGSYTMKPQSDVTAGSDYQINLLSTSSTNMGILAQSGQFNVTESSSSSSSSSTATSSTTSSSTSGSSTASTAAASTSTSASSTSSSESSSGSSSATASSSASTASASTGAAASLHIASGVAGLGFVGMIAALFA